MQHKLGYRGNEDWRDLSDFVVHLTKPGVPLLNILGSQRLIPGPSPFGLARNLPAIAESQRSVCFSEVPLGLLSRLAERRQSYDGLGFTKGFVSERGGLPVWYVEQDSPASFALEELVARTPRNSNEPLWSLTPFIDRPGVYGSAMYRFEWEREWRHVGELEFEPHDVAFLLLDESLHGQARSFFDDVYAERLGPSYFCAFIDPRWSESRVAAAFKEFAQQTSQDGPVGGWREMLRRLK